MAPSPPASRSLFVLLAFLYLLTFVTFFGLFWEDLGLGPAVRLTYSWARVGKRRGQNRVPASQITTETSYKSLKPIVVVPGRAALLSRKQSSSSLHFLLPIQHTTVDQTSRHIRFKPSTTSNQSTSSNPSRLLLSIYFLGPVSSKLLISLNAGIEIQPRSAANHWGFPFRSLFSLQSLSFHPCRCFVFISRCLSPSRSHLIL
ncbi:hypothetical protein BDY24DRAFT_433885 [Mrakia frigida]|uniref:uncharacterized protein n=1 Tax=Mrakia frigida TaxID=29902 RepID=UPI003FCBEFFD